MMLLTKKHRHRLYSFVRPFICSPLEWIHIFRVCRNFSPFFHFRFQLFFCCRAHIWFDEVDFCFHFLSLFRRFFFARQWKWKIILSSASTWHWPRRLWTEKNRMVTHHDSRTVKKKCCGRLKFESEKKRGKTKVEHTIFLGLNLLPMTRANKIPKKPTETKQILAFPSVHWKHYLI